MSAITNILAGDNITDSRAVINTNVTNLNTDKLEASDITWKQDILAEWAFVNWDKTKLDWIETGADVTDTANVTSAWALMDSEVDADIKTLVLPASTTISTFWATLVDDIDAWTARTTLNVDIAWTDNSTPVTVTDTAEIDLTLVWQDVKADLKTTTVTAWSYTLSNLTIDSKWRVTAASNWSGSWTPLTTKWDLLSFSTVDARLPIWTNWQQLQADSAEVTWLKWATPAGWWDVTAWANLWDNLLIRWDWAGKWVQNSWITIDDSDNVTWLWTLNWNAIATWTNTGDQTISDATITTTDITTNDFSITKHWFTPKWTNVWNFLKDDWTWATPAWTWDMVLADVQSVTWLKTFDKDKAAMKGTSTWVNTISVANTSVTSYTNTIPAQTGTFAMTSDITWTNSGTNTGDQTTVTWNAWTATALQTARTIWWTSFDWTANIAIWALNSTNVWATTSAELAGVLSDETWTGLVVFGTSPTLVTPVLWTPTSATLTNATWLPVAWLANWTDWELITWSATWVATTVAVWTATHVLTSNWVWVAPTFQASAWGGWTWVTIFNWEVNWELTVWKIFETLSPWAFTATEFRCQTDTLPVGASIVVNVYKNWTIDATATIIVTETLVNWLYTDADTTFVSWSYVATDRVSVEITAVWSTVPWTNLSWTLS